MKRFNDLDIAKGIAIFLVVFGHTTRDGSITHTFYFFHLPLFFILSGYFFSIRKYTSFGDFFKQNAKTLLLPYATFYLLSYIYWVVIERNMRPGGDAVPLIRPLFGFFYATDYKDYMTPNGAVWFLPALFMCKNALYGMVKFIHNKIVFLVILSGMAILSYVLPIWADIRLPFSINSALMGLFFVGIGYLAKPYYEQLRQNKLLNKLLWLLCAAVLSAIAIVYNITPDIDYCRYGILPIFLVGAIAGTLFCLLISNFISKSRPLEYLGRNSLIIMGFSEPVKRLILGVFSMATHKSMDDVRYSLPISLLCATVTILVLIPIIYIFTKYLPFTIGLSNKKKTGTIN